MRKDERKLEPGEEVWWLDNCGIVSAVVTTDDPHYLSGHYGLELYDGMDGPYWCHAQFVVPKTGNGKSQLILDRIIACRFLKGQCRIDKHKAFLKELLKNSVETP